MQYPDRDGLVARSPLGEAGNRELKDFLLARLYRHPKVEAMRFKAERFLTEIKTTKRWGTVQKCPQEDCSWEKELIPL